MGAGEVGRRVSRQLGGSDAVTALVVVDSDGLDLVETDIVVLCGPDEVQFDQAQVALGRAAHVVSLADSTAAVSSMLALVDYATEVGRSVVVGAAASPGLSSLLAVHAAEIAGELDEVVVAVAGIGGPACSERRTRALRSETQEWRDGEWIDCDARSGSELVWFPEPLGAIDCVRGDLSDGLLLRRVLPSSPTISVRAQREIPAPTPSRRFRRTPPPEPGSVRVSVSGRRPDGPTTVVYAAVAPAAESSAAVASAAVLELAARHGRGDPPLVGGPAELLDARPALARIAQWGVRLMVFEGID